MLKPETFEDLLQRERAIKKAGSYQAYVINSADELARLAESHADEYDPTGWYNLPVGHLARYEELTGAPHLPPPDER